MTTLSFDEFFGASQPASPQGTGEKPLTLPEPVLADMRRQGQPVRWQGRMLDVSGSEPVYSDNPQVTPKEGPKTMSFDEFFGAKPSSGGVTQGEPLPSWSTEENLSQTLDETGKRIIAGVKALPKGALQTGAALSDMILGSPGMVWKSSVYAGARAAGVSADEAEEYSNRLTPDGILAPVQSTIQALGLGEGSSEQAVNKAMDILTQGIKKGSAWLSERTNGAVPPEDFENVATNLMGIAGVKGGQAMTAKVIANAEKARQAGIVQQDIRRVAGPDQRTEPTMGEPNESGTATPSPEPTPEGAGRVATVEANDGQASAAPQGARPFEANALWRGPEGDRPVEILQRDFEQTPEGRSFTKVRDETGTEAVIPSDQLAGAGKPKVVPRKPSGAIDTDLLNLMGGASAAIAAGGWAYMNPEEAKNIIGGAAGLAALGAVKDAKGGVWHPEAVNRLQEPLFKAIVRGNQFDHFTPDELRNPAYAPETVAASNLPDNLKEPLKQAVAIHQWTESRVKTYLNRHMGTATDPLKDVRIPMLGDDVRWEDVTDQLVKPQKNVEWTSSSAHMPDETHVEGARPGETIWNISDTSPTYGHADYSPEYTAMTNYLSHVGDYLREFVPPEKLGQYDLVRAVRETAAQDEKQAAKMAKARVNQEGTVDYKTYPDGMKWVEVGVPAKEGIPKGYEIVKSTQEPGMFVVDTPYGTRINTLTGNKNRTFATREEAASAARVDVADSALRNEGDIMGHCVGGYCEMVHSGKSRIFSLRDGKGMSHVTVEVSPPDPRVQGTTPRDFANMIGGDLLRRYNEAYKTADMSVERSIVQSPEYQAWMKDKPSDIVQIKGKQNRAPVDKYLPYVQDFVKSGKWGDVGDLGNAGLVDSAQFKTLAKNVQDLPGAKELLDKRFLTENEMEYLASGGRVPLSQQGKIDPRLLARMAAVGLGAAAGAYLDPENPISAAIKGALAGVAVGHLSPKGVVSSIKTIMNPAPLVKIDQLRKWTEGARKAAGRQLWQMQRSIEELAPKAEQQIKLTRALRGENVGPLTWQEAKALDKARQFFNDMWEYANKAGVIKTFEQNYITQLWGKKQAPTILEKIKTVGGTGSGTSTKTPYALNRTYTFQEGIAAGLKPLTEDLSTIMGIYGNSVIKAVENTKFINTLKNVRDKASGNKLLMKDSAAVPRDYVYIDHPQLRGYRINPDIAPDMRFIFDANDPNIVFRGLEALNTTQKRMAVSLSLFHAKALEDANLGASNLLKAPWTVTKSFAQAALPRVFGENTLLKEVRKGGAGDLVDKAQKAGLEFGYEHRAPVIEELNKGFYEFWGGAQKILDQSFPGLGKVTAGSFIKINHAFDNFMWGRLHAGLKLSIFADKYAQLLKNDPKMSEQRAAEMAASFANDTFGGLNWQRLSMEPSTRIGREVAAAVYGPTGRRFLRLALFAPDWTISTTRAFVKGITSLPRDIKAEGITGPIQGLWKPSTLGDLHRQYIMRSAFWYLVIGDSLNVAMTGHHLWDNKDPTRLELADGRTMQWSKHSMEPIHWMTMPGQQALNKLGFIPKEFATQALHKEYLSTHHMPEMQSRIGHVAKNFSPIAAGQAMGAGGSPEGIQAAVASSLGAPIYGKTNQQREDAKALGKLKAAATRARNRAAKMEANQ